jgi:adenylate cyclase
MKAGEDANPRRKSQGRKNARAWAPSLTRYARRHLSFLIGLVIVASASGVAYRYLFDPIDERVPSFFLRSCLHAIGLAIAGWSVHLSLAAAPPPRLRDWMRQLPQAAELAIKALVMTALLMVVTIGLQLLLYPDPFPHTWLVHSLPLIVGIAFCVSLRLIGGRVLGSFLLGTYHRPKREQRIVMFLDMAVRPASPRKWARYGCMI